MKTTGGELQSDDESDMEQYELTEDEEEQEHKDVPLLDAIKRSKRKRKRSITHKDEDEDIARRRRRRRSLGFQQRRRSLTANERKAAAAAGGSGGSTATTHSKQYISDMYSTIIKMSSENKINVKNSWSLHLIDHMEDILDSNKRNAADGDNDTYNFQKASCTLDASIKIYSYRVDDTWNSSYKILENLSRTEQKHGVDDTGSDAEGGAKKARKTRKTHARTIEKNLNNINLKAYDMECEADPLFHKMSQSFDEGGAKGMLLANLSVYDGCKILLNSSDVSMVTRKQIHMDVGKSKDEPDDKEKQKLEKPTIATTTDAAVDVSDENDVAKAKSDGSEGQKDEGNDDGKEGGGKESEAIESNPAVDNKRSDEDITIVEEHTKEKEMSAEDAEFEEPENECSIDDVTTEEEVSKEKIVVAEDAIEESTKCKDTVEIVSDEERIDTHPAFTARISLSLFGSMACIDQDIQSLRVCPSLYRMYEQLDEFYGDESRHKLGIRNDFLLTTPVKGRRQTLDKKDVAGINLAGIMEGASDDESDGEDTAHDVSVEFGEDVADYDADAGTGGTGGEAADVVEVDTAADVDMEKENDIVDLAQSDEEDHVPDDFTQNGTESDLLPLDKESSLRSTAVDFFRAKVNENMPEDYENNLFFQMIESALVRSVTIKEEQGGEDQNSKNDYSYFDVKMLRNWAGPGHWKFPAVRKMQMKQRHNEETDKDGLEGANGEVDEDGVAIKAEPNGLFVDRAQKGSSAGVDKKTVVMVDFFGEAPDVSRLKAPKSTTSLEVSKGNLKKQMENASDLVLPVDTHIELSLFFRHFLKERPRFFRKRGGSGVSDGARRESASAADTKYRDASGDTADEKDRKQPFTYNEDSAGFEGGYDDEDEEEDASVADETQELYSVQGLVQADRVVEKIGVHYERFAKRVDVKKLKGSIWEHLEKKFDKGEGETDDATNVTQTDVDAMSVNESGKRFREPETNELEDSDNTYTTFENVVENVAGKVPSNVTVSFYFICVLHLANEKGLELAGQKDLRNFRICKEDA
ncbi:unnamed protein product [Peronospora farinosa]|uniref:Condensin complex subunit 2 n=1 Tax=Peronospora farinosa TaxID=134698 RepID=A0AAV0UP94_9STRA|nr:unnamed protein product [Peronospora farinosa]CAI5737299.1 unnamed protein product [Peronospora farinosa]